jgi:hypothetical protein
MQVDGATEQAQEMGNATKKGLTPSSSALPFMPTNFLISHYQMKDTNRKARLRNATYGLPDSD